MPTVFDIADQHRAALLRHERDAAAALVRAYGAAWQRLQARLGELQQQLAAAQARGEPINAAWLLRQERYRALRQQLESELQRLTAIADGQIRDSQAWAITQAEAHAEQLTRASLGPAPAGVAVNFNRVPRGALEALVGMTAAGSPLRSQLAALSTQGAQVVIDELVANVALGVGPRETTRRLRRAFAMPLGETLTLTRTATLSSYRVAAQRSYQANRDLITGWIWHAKLDTRTCFPAGTLVTTRRGAVPIEQVVVGDEVLTHTGRYRQVYETLRRDYHGPMITVAAGARTVTATSNHPVLVERQGQLDWVEAGDLRLGDTVFSDSEDTADIRNHGVADGLTVERRGDKAYHGVPARLQRQRFACITLGGLRMPVRFINFKRRVERRHIEINRTRPARQYLFLLERDTERDQAQARVALWFRFARKAAVAAHRAKAALALLGRLHTKHLVTGQAGGFNRRAATGFGTIATVRAAHPKNGSAPFARRILSVRKLTGFRAVHLIGLTRKCGERGSTTGAGFDRTSRGHATGFRAVAMRFATMLGAKYRAAVFTRLLSAGTRGLTARFAAMRVFPLIQTVTGGRTEASSATFDPRRGNREDRAALLASSFHRAIISSLACQIKRQAVYNIEVADDHSYVANGFVVHNCAVCWAMHGSAHDLDESFASHYNCRCGMVPKTRTWRELGFDIAEVVPPIEAGPARFARLSAADQRAILGPTKHAAYAAGRLTLADVVGERHDPIWGLMRYERSFKAIQGGG